ncbi:MULTISPECIES: branched-chain amino acid ABC transporter permease [Thalassobaculum]|uniref:Amino acid/amide ABC transporter membrane protein 2, HAAT family n=1 Tax=Thalassobaculum litoreum DSM 18839 TaxID=1123362 RepID=A0A8G2BK20_9PROT|nr:MULTISPECIES: branched-chain amino acid ABC transporter permease [Thalassobaculum]SDG15019.1 amino acid/amide ABC transporter membrane protein 2, HAAT family [Thalassobaculum litoreum DSM 18839]
MNLIVQFRRDLLIAAAALVVLVAIGLGIEHAWPRDFLTAIFAAGLLAMSLNMLIGYTGLVSFGHAAFFALGGYIFGLLLQSQAFTGAMGAASVPLALVAAVVGTGLYAVVIGAICVRLTEIYFAFLTLAFQMFLYSVILSWVDLTGGDQGLMGGIPRPEFLGIDLGDQYHRYVFCAVLFVVCVMIMRIMTESPFGYTLRMIRDNATRAAFLGVNVTRVKLICFVVSSSIAAVGGVILALFTSGAYPEWAFWAQSGEAIFMIMLGGLNVFLGPILGAVALRILNDVVQMYTSHTEIVIGLVIMFVVLGLRRGILDFVKDWWVEKQQARLAAENRNGREG